MESEDFLLVAAFDFGTAYSGYAFSFIQEPFKIYANTGWNAASRSLLSQKTPTCILLTPDKEFHSFGYEAENMYAELAESEKHANWFYFKHFKMILHDNEDLNRGTTINDIMGKPLPALTIFRMSIEFLKDHLMSTVEKRLPSVRQSDFKYVITVPAIWDDSAKQFMREAATEAGIDGAKLKIALEPEAASIYCQNIPSDCSVWHITESYLDIFKPGAQYMVVDLGGGTADITVHEKNKDGTLKEMYTASGGPWGGMAVDKNFIQLLSEILGSNIMDKYSKHQTEDYLDLMRELEVKKRAIKPGTKVFVNFKVPGSLKEMYEGENGTSIQSAVAFSRYRESLKWSGDKLRISFDVLKELFNGPIDKIVSYIKHLFQQPKLQNVSTITLVGGFSECVLVQQKIEDAFVRKKVVIPPDCELAVLKGAVIFGHRPKSITSRVSRYTYGNAVIRKFEPSIHPPEYKIYRGGKDYCDFIFQTFVKKGEEVRLGHAITKNIRPALVQDKSITFDLYKSPSTNPMYTKDAGCECLGTFKVPVVDGGNKEEKKLECSMIFGDTELMFMAKQIKTGKVFQMHLPLEKSNS